MRSVVQRHLRAPSDPPVEFVACKVTFARRGSARSYFQYHVTLRDPASESEWNQLVSGVTYGRQRTRTVWESLQHHHPASPVGGTSLARAAYVPELDLLLQVFPFDHQLPALELLMAGPLPDLVAPLLARFGPGDWRLEGWGAESVRYWVDVRATIRLTVTAYESGSGCTAERHFFAKIYGSAKEAERAWNVQRDLATALAAGNEPLAIAPPAAHLPGARVLVQDEVQATSLLDLLLTGDAGEATEAVRRTARTIAALHHLAVTAPMLLDGLERMDPQRLRRRADTLRAARPDLAPVVAEIEANVLAALAKDGEGPSVPVHGDFKPRHVLFDDDRVVLLDLDEFAAGEPMLDVTNMLIHLRGERQSRQSGSTLARAFVEEYFAHAPRAWEQRLAPHYAWALLGQASALGKRIRGSQERSSSSDSTKQENPIDVLLEEAQAVLVGRARREDLQPDQIHGESDSPRASRRPKINGERYEQVGVLEALRMEEPQGELQGASAQADQSPTDRTPGATTDQDKVSAETIFTYLATNSDLARLVDKYPQLTSDDLRAFAHAQALVQGAPTVRSKQGAIRTGILRTHGLPEPDPSIHKANIFKALVALLQRGRMLDLGAGNGNFSIAAAQLGWAVTAVDVRTARWPNPEMESDPDLAALIRTISWVHADVREFPIEHGEYDLISVLGLLHHLEVPDQVSLLKRCSGTPTLLDTRIAPAIVNREGPYEGALVREHGETREERDAVLYASWGNPLSFQHTEESLLRLVLDCGFIKMLQMRPPHGRDYTFYLCLPTSAYLRPTVRRAQRDERQARRQVRRSRGKE
jgi:aminoglycoside phosphotransferase (APT) family kinase protein/SAM-dependent methyltransferase